MDCSENNMSEEQSAENHDYDREDIEHVENMLYANIHYNSGCTDNQLPSTSQAVATTSYQNNQTANRHSVDGKDAQAKQNARSRRNAKRYWTSDTPHFVPFFKEKQSGIYNSKSIPGSPNDNNAKEAPKKIDQNQDTNAVAVKQFTPYVSFLPFTGSAPNVTAEETSTNSSSKIASNPKVLKTTNDMVRKSLTAKNINPFSKKHMIDSIKEMYSEKSKESDACMENENKKRLNPFNPLSRKAKRKKTDAKQNNSIREKPIESKRKVVDDNVINIDVDQDDDDDDCDDDDVIILPTQAPPLICVDSSDEEAGQMNAKEHSFTEPNAVTDNRRKGQRCASPSSSIQSTDDFIGQNDQRNFGFESFATLSDDDLCQVSEPIESNLPKKKSNVHSGKRATSSADDNAIFTPPKQMQKEKIKQSASTKKSYEVAANSFAAVDVYESESSDMPDSIYAKGAQRKRKIASDSDTSVESVSIVKSKRLRKRKSSGSAKESDKHSDDSSSDLPEIDDESEDDELPNENSYLVRGEALGKVKNTNKKRKISTKTVQNKNAEDEFMNKLSSIMHGQNESDENDELESTQETSTESVAARDIVKSVLQRRRKKSKKNQNTEDEANQTKNDELTKWAITDEIGETDDLNIARIFEDNTLNSTAIGEEEEREPVKNSSCPQEKSPKRNQNVQPNESNKMNAPNESNQFIDDHDNWVNNDDDHNFDAEMGWNDEMKLFYNESWGGETFSLKHIRGRMPKGFLNWVIANRDKCPPIDNMPRRSRCLNCQEKGHHAKNCPRPPATKRCYMCGVEGHYEPRCPNKICLLCGRKTQKYTRGCAECFRDRDLVCYICKRKGHRQIMCPDRWRRYHATTSTKQELVPTVANSSNKPKFCCICTQKGHTSEWCNRTNRSSAIPSWNVSSYRPVLPVKNCASNTPQFTILASNVGDYSFNLGNDVPTTGNTIYSRFCRAVNLTAGKLNQSTISDNDVMLVNESNLHDLSEPAIEIYDDFEIDDAEDISSSENFTSDTQGSSFISFDGFNDSSTANTSIELETRRDSTTDNAEAQMKELDNKMQTLTDLKEQMLLHKNSDTCQTTDQDQECDTDAPVCEQTDDVTTSTILPDFIPLSTGEPDKYEPIRSPSPISADSTTTANDKMDATIHLTPQNCKYLLSDKGNEFLRGCEERFNVSVRLEWRNFGNVLIVIGIASNQIDFHTELKSFFQSHDDSTKSTSFKHVLPKSRDALVQYVRTQVAQLDSPICNNKHLANVQYLYQKICTSDRNPTKRSKKQICRFRKQLNMVLFGRYGFADGKVHLTALQDRLRNVIQSQSEDVSMQLRRRMGENMDYIFSDIDHQNYEIMIERYNQMLKDKCLPPLNLDRKLMGLKINVMPNALKNMDNFREYAYASRHLGSSSRNSMPNENTNEYANKMKAIPSSSDIQINVSASHYNNNSQ